jgi:energy-coupling factor transporter ATP-binding protein EcfA2
MRIETIQLSWFRGAGEQAALPTAAKSVAVYGANGSGKSTFADAIEYFVRNGRIEHLAHEYSGSRQEKGVRNTHAPPSEAARIRIEFSGGACAELEVSPDGSLSIASQPLDLRETVQGWEIERLILRQDEVADFVHAAKGKKYSVLLPLLGLDSLERAAENLRQLAQRVRNRSELAQKGQRLEDLCNAAIQHLPDLSEEKVTECLRQLAGMYVRHPPKELGALTEAVASGIEGRIKSAAPENRRHLLLGQIHGEDLAQKMGAVTEAEANIHGEVDALLGRRIAVLERAQAFITELGGDEEEIDCPACGRSIRAVEFVQHVRGELTALESARAARTAARNARRVLALSLGQVLTKIKEPEVCSWVDLPPERECKEAVARLGQIDLDQWEEGWSADALRTLNSCIPTVTRHVQTAIDAAPPSTQQLIEDEKVVEAAASLPKIKDLKLETASINDIIDALEASEAAVRDAIKARTRLIIQGISGEAQRLWSKLHPEEPIEDIHLHIPGDADKAIDIGLKFFGVDQPSPRLTLSEGHRNSLGLCIFLALVGVDKAEDRPIILDDIVSSLDRGHRGMLVDVLLEDLGERQVLLFTHDREWFAELRARLPSAGWRFMALRPWESPDVGLQWSARTDTFDDARALIAVRPEAAGNCVRAIMDGELAIAAQNLRLLVPHLIGDRNDRRTSVDFLERIISEGRKRLRKRAGNSWVQYPDPIEDWKEAHRLLIAWANRASHTGTLIKAEVDRLIKVCETALSHFHCGCCHDPIWIADVPTRERLECSCREMQWRYG